MEVTMLYDASKCTGCRACMVACKQWKSLPAEQTPFIGEFQSHPDLSSKTYTLIRMSEQVEGGKFKWNFLKFQCMHCGEASCVKACPQKALTHGDNGVVTFNADKCVGCGYCVNNCPFGVPHIDEETNKSTKCNFCGDRIAAGMEPSCAQTCPSNALVFGWRDRMVALAEERVRVLQQNNPQAQTYGIHEAGVGGTHMIYVLENEPAVYGLPANPQVPYTLTLWKDVIHPLGSLAMGGAIAMAAASYVGQKLKEGRERLAASTEAGSGKQRAGKGKGVDM
jgi:formate dehydrogenase iron-sulfur subunit